MNLLFVVVVFEGQTTEGGRRRLVDFDGGASQQSHQREDPVELQHLSNESANTEESRHSSYFEQHGAQVRVHLLNMKLG